MINLDPPVISKAALAVKASVVMILAALVIFLTLSSEEEQVGVTHQLRVKAEIWNTGCI